MTFFCRTISFCYEWKPPPQNHEDSTLIINSTGYKNCVAQQSVRLPVKSCLLFLQERLNHSVAPFSSQLSAVVYAPRLPTAWWCLSCSLLVQDLQLASLSARPSLGRDQTAITQQFLFW